MLWHRARWEMRSQCRRHGSIAKWRVKDITSLATNFKPRQLSHLQRQKNEFFYVFCPFSRPQTRSRRMKADMKQSENSFQMKYNSKAVWFYCTHFLFVYWMSIKETHENHYISINKSHFSQQHEKIRTKSTKKNLITKLHQDVCLLHCIAIVWSELIHKFSSRSSSYMEGWHTNSKEISKLQFKRHKHTRPSVCEVLVCLANFADWN